MMGLKTKDIIDFTPEDLIVLAVAETILEAKIDG